jgi:hypothetical protein
MLGKSVRKRLADCVFGHTLKAWEQALDNESTAIGEKRWLSIEVFYALTRASSRFSRGGA